MKGIFTLVLIASFSFLSGCELTEEDKEKLDSAAKDLEQLADQIIITSPAKGSTVNQSIVTVRADIPASANAQQVALYVDGIEIAKDTDGAPWEIEWPAYFWADGNVHSLFLKTVTASGVEVRNLEQFQVTVSEDATQALTFTAGIDGAQIQDQNTFEVNFHELEGATGYEVTDDNQIVEASSNSAELLDLDVGNYELKYRAIFKYSESTTLIGPWSNPVNISVLPPQLPIIETPIVEYNNPDYSVEFTWDPVADGDDYKLILKKNEGSEVVYENLENSLTVPDLDMGTYSWSLIRTNGLQQEANYSDRLEVGVFKRQLGGSGNEYADRVIASKEGGFIILGSTRSKGDAQGDDWIIKLDAKGNTEWEYVLNKTGNLLWLDDIREFSDGSIYAFGSNRNYEDRKGYLLKLSGEANPVDRMVWELEYRQDGAEQEVFKSLAEKDSLLYVISEERVTVDLEDGSSKNRLSKVKLINFTTDSGSFVSEVELPALADGSRFDFARYLTLTTDNQFLLSCSAAPEASPEVYFGGACIMKFDEVGTLDWSHSYVSGHFASGGFAAETPWGTYVLSGESKLGYNVSLAVVSSQGEKVGSYTAGVNSFSYQREDMVFGENENILTLMSGRDSDLPELWSTSRTGSTQRLNVFDELRDNNNSDPISLVRSSDGGLVLLFNEKQVANNNYDIVVLKTDINGKM